MMLLQTTQGGMFKNVMESMKGEWLSACGDWKWAAD